MPAVVIGRERELDALSAAAMETAEGRGCIVFLSGPRGSGKSELVKAWTARTADSGVKMTVATTACRETGAHVPLASFGQILRDLTNRETRGDRARRVLKIIERVVPPLVGLIPGLGQIGAVAVEAGAHLGTSLLGGERETQQAQLASEVARALQGIADDEPLLVVIEDAQWIDSQSREVVDWLADDFGAHALMVVLAYDTETVGNDHDLTRLRANLIGKVPLRDVELADLDAEAVDGLLVARYGDLPDDRLGSWLRERTHGNLHFLVRYLMMLEERDLIREVDGRWALDGAIDGVPGDWRLRGRIAETPTPDTLIDLLKPRLGELEDEESILLESGSLQGPQFLSTVLARVEEQDERAVLKRLKALADRRLIEFEDVEGWWSDFSDLVSFDPAVLQELLYREAVQTPYQRKLRHGGVAAALEELVGSGQGVPRQALVELARQYELAGDPVAAATRLVRVAETTFAEGADRETALHAGKALELLDGEGVRDGSVETERLYARAALLLLLGGEPSWRTDTGGPNRLVALAAETERAADASGDDQLRAGARLAAAQLALAYKGLDAGVAAYEQAVEFANSAGDVVTEFAALLKLGHHRGSKDLRQGAAALEKARVLLESGRLGERLTPAAVTLEQGRLESALGVAKFDLGAYGEAWQLLESSVGILSTTRLDDDYAWALCFRGQLETALGLWDEAEGTLREAIAVFDDVRRALAARGYFRALLGRVAVERDPQQVDVARVELEPGWRETHEAKYVSVRPLVDVYWAELLLAEDTESARREADELLAAAENYGWVRGEVAMPSLRARIALREERLDDAVALSRQAYDRLTDLGGFVPAVRSEEIVFTHARVLEAVSPGSEEATACFGEAARILRKKAASLTDPAQRESLLQRVRLSREILASERRA